MTVISERFDNLGFDGAPKKLGIMGGTFDPVHNGHLNMAAEVAEKLGLNAVIFVPAGMPVFKRGQEILAAEDRLAMCRLAVSCNPLFDVSTVEIDREGDTYTVDTLRQLRAHYPDNVDFMLITGSDAASAIGKWRSSQEIAHLAQLVVVSRPGHELSKRTRESILQPGFDNTLFLETTLLDISSTEIRQRIREGSEFRYLVPPAVWGYIREHGLYGAEVNRASAEADAPEGTLWTPSFSFAGEERSARAEGEVAERGVLEEASDFADALSDEFYEARLAELETRVSAKRLAHIKGVAKTCVDLARQYGLDEREARLAGVLHDWDKGYSDEEVRARVKELGLEDQIDPWVVQNMPQVLHGQTAAVALEREWPQIPKSVIQAISRHTTAAPDMTDLDKVLYIADAIEPSRQFGRIDDLRSLVGIASLDELYFATYEYWVFLLFERRKPLHPDTIRIWNDYAAKRAASKGEK